MKTVQEMSLADLRAWRPRRVDFETIREMARRMAERCHPERIVLFGSYARGDATDGSDLDFLVIMESDLPRPKRSIPLFCVLRSYLVPKDIVVYTPAEVEEWADLPNSFVQTVLREGIVLYEKDEAGPGSGLVRQGG